MSHAASVFTLAFFLSSFSSHQRPVATIAYEHTKGSAVVPLRINETHTLETFLYLCNDEWIRFDDATIHYDYLYVDNKRTSIMVGKSVINGTGYSETTGEVFTLSNVESRDIQVSNFRGLLTVNASGTGTATGSQGTVYHFKVTSHFTLNPHGVFTSEKTTITESCLQ